MSPEAMRVAIAEACGWKMFSTGMGSRWRKNGAGDWSVMPPDYLNDLNAMAEAVKSLTDYKQRCAYSKNLLRVAKVYDVVATHASDFNATELDYYELAEFAEATAAQRAEAFCRTLYPERFAQPPAHPTGHTEDEG